MDGVSGYWWAIAAVVFAATLVVAVVLAVRLFRARRMLGDSGVPMSRKVLFWGALLYLVSPADLLPDPVLLDDIGVLLAALRSLHRAGARVRAEEPGGTA
ncbi:MULTISPECIES: YkvA family protein [unclassified Streptomyces]|uniref:YkvA family protein n=1 Tax=unclassified Streptomyces TaxID=2593676 RepID=UPI0036F87449